MKMDEALHKIGRGENLSVAEARALFDLIFAGEASESQMKAILLGLHNKGETVAEIQGAASSMREHMVAIRAPEGTIDIVGTGGDGHGTVNVSTAAAFVVAGAGVPVAKHGNRAATSLSGSSDVLGQLGVGLEVPFKQLERALDQVGIAFLFAPRHHPAMRFVAPVRKALGVRTIFNLLGPLTNPARVKRHLIGVFDFRWAQPMAETLRALGSESGWIAHGQDGLDELSTTTASDVVAFDGAGLRTFETAPEAYGLPRVTLQDLRGGDAAANARDLAAMLAGQKGPYRDIVLINAAAALIVAGRASDPLEARKLAERSIDTGAAQKALQGLIALTQEQDRK